MNIIEDRDIYEIARQIFREEPRDRNSIQIQITNINNPAIIFEIASILMCECVDHRLPRVLTNHQSINRFINQAKLYFQSFGMDFDYIHLPEHDGVFTDYLNFQSQISYFFEMRTEFQYYDFLINYQPDIHISDNLNDFKLVLKIYGHYYQVTFKFLR